MLLFHGRLEFWQTIVGFCNGRAFWSTANLFTVKCLQYFYKLFDIKQSELSAIWIWSRTSGVPPQYPSQRGFPQSAPTLLKEPPI
jgi:hypothetical protein